MIRPIIGSTMLEAIQVDPSTTIRMPKRLIRMFHFHSNMKIIISPLTWLEELRLALGAAFMMKILLRLFQSLIPSPLILESRLRPLPFVKKKNEL
jgi:hypothetical protein